MKKILVTAMIALAVLTGCEISYEETEGKFVEFKGEHKDYNGYNIAVFEGKDGNNFALVAGDQTSQILIEGATYKIKYCYDCRPKYTILKTTHQ